MEYVEVEPGQEREGDVCRGNGKEFDVIPGTGDSPKLGIKYGPCDGNYIHIKLAKKLGFTFWRVKEPEKKVWHGVIKAPNKHVTTVNGGTSSCPFSHEEEIWVCNYDPREVQP